MSAQEYILSSDIVELETDSHHAVYHRLRGGLCLLDNAARRILHKFQHPCFIDEHLLDRKHNSAEEELIQQFVLRGFLIPKGVDFESTPPIDGGGRISVVQLVMINQCNFGCKYCFLGTQGADTSKEQAAEQLIQISLLREQPSSVRVNLGDSIFASEERLQHQSDPTNRKMSPEDAVDYARKAIEIAKSTGTQDLMVQFFGGEPLMNWPACRAVLLACGHGEGAGIRIHYSTVTNGSMITDDMAQTLARYRVGVCVSFDSINSKLRPLKNGKDSAPVVLEGLRKLRQYNNYVAINAALTTGTWDDFDESIIDVAKEYNAREIGVVVDFDPSFYERFSATDIVAKILAVSKAGAPYGIVLTGYWHQIFQVLTDFDSVMRRGFKNCSAKGAQLSVEPNGSVFSCKAGSGLFGSINSGNGLLQSEVYRAHANLRHQNPSICTGCEIEGFCAGLCLGTLEKKFGTVNAIEPAACEFYRKITRELIRSVKPHEVAMFELLPT